MYCIVRTVYSTQPHNRIQPEHRVDPVLAVILAVIQPSFIIRPVASSSYLERGGGEGEGEWGGVSSIFMGWGEGRKHQGR